MNQYHLSSLTGLVADGGDFLPTNAALLAESNARHGHCSYAFNTV